MALASQPPPGLLPTTPQHILASIPRPALLTQVRPACLQTPPQVTGEAPGLPGGSWGTPRPHTHEGKQDLLYRVSVSITKEEMGTWLSLSLFFSLHTRESLLVPFRVTPRDLCLQHLVGFPSCEIAIWMRKMLKWESLEKGVK